MSGFNCISYTTLFWRTFSALELLKLILKNGLNYVKSELNKFEAKGSIWRKENKYDMHLINCQNIETKIGKKVEHSV
jgi:hypothetical protein